MVEEMLIGWHSQQHKTRKGTALRERGLLAQQCPAAVGPCVYKARGLLSMLLPGLSYSDDAACAALLPTSKTSSNTSTEDDMLNNMTAPIDEQEVFSSIKPNEFITYPNPIHTNTQLNILYDISTTDEAICKITDVMGRLVLELKLEGGRRRVVTDINDIAAGIYLITIYNNGKTVYNKQLHVVE
jgi:hypothetical protein